MSADVKVLYCTNVLCDDTFLGKGIGKGGLRKGIGKGRGRRG